jgi:hypothetical protein
MPAATLEHSSKDHAPVFVSGGRRRTQAVRVAAATLGILLAGWLGALAGGLIGFSPLPELALPGTGSTRTAPADRASQPAAKRDANVNASPIARVPASSDHNEASRAQSSASPGASGGGTGGGGSGAEGSGGGTVEGGTSSTSPNTGGGSVQPQPTAPIPGPPAHASPGNPPSFAPPASGEKSASPPRGNSANAPGRTVSADPPGKATRPHSG